MVTTARHDLPPEVAVAVGRYLERIDAALPDRIEGFYLVGSTALGAFQPGRSDIDFVAVVSDTLHDSELKRLKRMQQRLYYQDVARTMRPTRWPLTPNGVFIRWDDFGLPPTEIAPLAQHVARHFDIGRGFDVNPVQWHTLSTCGIAVRGPAVESLGIVADDQALREWTVANLNFYWKRWADEIRRPGMARLKASFRHMAAAWGALGAPRLHYTIATGGVISKVGAGEYALETFDKRWAPLLNDALDYWQGAKGPNSGGPFRPVRGEIAETAAFVALVVDSANDLWQSMPSRRSPANGAAPP